MPDNNAETTLVLGKEYDRRIWSALREVFQRLGAVEGKESWGLAGSQEIQSFSATIEGRTVSVEAETYIGISVTGPKELIEAIARMVNLHLAREGVQEPPSS